MFNTVSAKQNTPVGKWASLLLCGHNRHSLTSNSAGNADPQGSIFHILKALPARLFLPTSGVPYPFLTLFFSIALSTVLSLFILFSVYFHPLECRPIKTGFHLFYCYIPSAQNSAWRIIGTQ